MRGWRVHPARVLAKRPLEAAGEVFQRERAGFAQRPFSNFSSPIVPQSTSRKHILLVSLLPFATYHELAAISVKIDD